MNFGFSINKSNSNLYKLLKYIYLLYCLKNQRMVEHQKKDGYSRQHSKVDPW